MADGSQVIEGPKVRVATPDDLDAMMEISLMGCEENAFVPHNPAKVLEDVWAALHMDHGICGVIGEPGHSLEAAILLRVGTIWYSDAPTLEERAIFVHPGYRSAKGGRAAKLARFARDTADALGIPLTIGVLSDNRTQAKVRMYRRIMGEPNGAYWVYYPRGYARPSAMCEES